MSRAYMFVQFQVGVAKWVRDCFGTAIAENKIERSKRFLEEALELVQAAGLPMEDVAALTAYVYARPIGELKQEVGGVLTTLAALCSANEISMGYAAEVELKRCLQRTQEIRAKQAMKLSAGIGCGLPQHVPEN